MVNHLSPFLFTNLLLDGSLFGANARIINVSSEIDPLKKVIVHRPDDGIERISPKKAEELLFDDIVHLFQMQAEK